MTETERNLVIALYEVCNRIAWKLDVLAAIENLETCRLLERELEILKDCETLMEEIGVKPWGV